MPLSYPNHSLSDIAEANQRLGSLENDGGRPRGGPKSPVRRVLLTAM